MPKYVFTGPGKHFFGRVPAVVGDVVEMTEQAFARVRDRFKPQEPAAQLQALLGPTLEEFEAAGYDAKNYPPEGYAERPSPRLDEYRASLQAPPATSPEPATPAPVSVAQFASGLQLEDDEPNGPTTQPVETEEERVAREMQEQIERDAAAIREADAAKAAEAATKGNKKK